MEINFDKLILKRPMMDDNIHTTKKAAFRQPLLFIWWN